MFLKCCLSAAIVINLLRVKSRSAYITPDKRDYPHSIMSPHLRGGGILILVWIPLILVFASAYASMLVSDHTFLSAWTRSWILNKFSLIYNWDKTKNWLNFGDLDLIFKFSAVEKLKISRWIGTSVFSENTVTRYSYFFIMSTHDICFCWGSSNDQGPFAQSIVSLTGLLVVKM